MGEQQRQAQCSRRWVSLRVSTNGMRTIEKQGIDVVVERLRKQGHKV